MPNASNIKAKSMHLRACVCMYVRMYIRTCLAAAERKAHETDRYKEGEGVNQITVQDEGGVGQVYTCM